MMPHRNPGTFLPPPHCDGVIRFHSNWEQKLSCGTEVDIANPFSMGAAKDGQSLLGHGVPHMDRWSHSWDKRSELNRPDRNYSNRTSILQWSTCPGLKPCDSTIGIINKHSSGCLQSTGRRKMCGRADCPSNKQQLPLSPRHAIWFQIQAFNWNCYMLLHWRKFKKNFLIMVKL